MLPPPTPACPPWRLLPWPEFWRRFEAAAPPHLRWGLMVSVHVVGVLWLGAHGCAVGATAWGPDDEDDEAAAARRDRALQSAMTTPVARTVLAPMLELLRVVAALAYFDDLRVQRAFRGEDVSP